MDWKPLDECKRCRRRLAPGEVKKGEKFCRSCKRLMKV